MINLATIKIGEKVYYQPDYYKADDKFENGIIKEIPEHTTTSVRVVYKCGGDWKNYKDYNSALTSVDDLYYGWKHKEIEISDDYLND
ncbi:hypothetical protein M0Q97_13240 [Candidatus Dojkabacteria bacterium]|jgi:hypothetical protein|nr:hypothetical protein [Candidatus Dojkabacteria bacterium]